MFMRDKGQVGIEPFRDWGLLLSLFFALLLIVGGIHFYMFLQISHDEIFQASGEQAGVTKQLNEKGLSEVLIIYNGKKETFDTLKTNPPKVVDPSL